MLKWLLYCLSIGGIEFHRKTSSALNSFLPKRFLYIGNVLIISLSGTDCTVLSVPRILNIYSQPMATEHFQSPLCGSVTVFCSISHLLRHFPSSALAWRHSCSNSVTRNYCCRAREVTLPFMDTLIALTYLLTYLLTCIMVVNSFINSNVNTIYFTQMKQWTMFQL